MLVASALEDEPTRPPAMHLNLESKAPWHETLDAAPRFDGLAPGMEPRDGDG
jgi:hypothetical protein